MPDEPRKHLTDAVGGRAGVPLSDVERVEWERARNLVQSVASCYNSLVSQATDPDRRAELAAELAFHDGELRRLGTMSGAERRTVIGTYPDLLARLRTELDG
ncbi:hypothetical protein [Kribbella sindirgiensis]|uniref:Uncharacterized protein n=1 Tax=Kribbella sindirgiensis TaxID=1124744 RepID=A0A4R0IFM4_9ACTN|nr:hypothetical protein [Kribbella sindirgiensis]TCC31319.1 hypothetical protein E0H50_21815 [Kribbella sindirgiensis]